MQKPSIIIQDVVLKNGDDTVLDGISFSLLPNDHLAITGSSESGNASLAKVIAGKIPFKGKIFLNITATDTRIELVEQRYIFKNLSGLHEFYYQQRFNSFDSEDAPTVYQELLKLLPQDSKQANNIDSNLGILGIGHLKNSPLIQLSSGEHKRFQLAKSLLNPPAILILDLPYEGLDVLALKELNKILDRISKKGTQIILIPGTFPIPGFITQIAFLENKKISFFGRKENFDADKFIVPAAHQLFYNKDLLPVSKENSRYETIAELKNVTLKYGDNFIFQHLNWKINEGEKWLLKGRNGSGKSSLLSMITGDHPQAYSNQIYLFGKRRGSGESIWDIKKNIGFISPELFAFFDKNITFFQAIGSGYFDTIGLFKKLNAEQHKNILQWLDFLQISHVSTKPLHSISASLQRMILLARALVKNPPLIVLDEPCQGLDQLQSSQLVSLVDHICSGFGKTLIYVSHDQRNIPGCIEKVFQLEKNENQYDKTIEKAALAVA